MLIRYEKNTDYEAVEKVIIAAFGQPDEATLVSELRESGDAEFSLVAEQAEQIVGHIMFSKMNGPVRTLGLAPVSVLPEFQGQGIGGKLIEDGLEMARTRGWQAVFVLGDNQYYPRFGFSSALADPFMSPYAGPYFMAVELEPGALQGQSGAVSYASAFSNAA